jgi:AAA family ATP:ADP antiporter
MKNSRLYKILSRVITLYPGEEKNALLFFLYFFLITAPHTIIKSLRNAVFLDYLGKNSLPYAYLLTALLTGLVVALHTSMQERFSKYRLIQFSLAFFILTAVIFWLLFPSGHLWLPMVYWVWANLMVVVLMAHFWLTVNEVYNPREIKRLVGFFGSGGILGGIAGGLLTRIFAGASLSNHLLILSAALLVPGMLIVSGIFKQKTASQEPQDEIKKKPGWKSTFSSLKTNSYLTLLSVMVTLSLIVSTLIDFQYNGIIEQSIQGQDNLTGFFGVFNAGLMLVAFLLQLVLTGPSFNRLGVKGMLIIYPFALLVFSLGLVAFPVLIAAVLLKGSDKSLSYSLNQSAREILYLPIPSDLKYQAKVVIDVFLNRIAKAAGALLLVIFIHFELNIRFISAISSIFIIGWIIVNLRVSREYVDTVKQSIKRKWHRAEKSVSDTLDMDYTKLIFDLLESQKRSPSLYAMCVYDLKQQGKLTPDVKRMIAQNSDEAKVSSLGDLFSSEGSSFSTEAFLDSDELTSDVEEIMSLDNYQKVIDMHADQVMQKSREANLEKMELAKIIGLMPPESSLSSKLPSLIQDESPEVARFAMESAARLRKEETLPMIVDALENPLKRDDAVAALAKFEDKAVTLLKPMLGEEKTSLEVKRAVVAVLSQLSSHLSTETLLESLPDSEAGLTSAIIDALDKIRSEQPDVWFSPLQIEPKLLNLIKQQYKLLLQEEELDESEQKERQVLKKSMADKRSNIFKLMGLLYSHDDIMKAYQNIQTGTKKSVAYALELLDNTLQKELRDLIIPLVEEYPPDLRKKKYRQIINALE